MINLRGEKPNASNSLSFEMAGRLGLRHEFLAFESRGAPHRERILRYHETYQTLAFPALIHCKSGADRAGLAAGLAIMFEGGTAAQALGQLSWRFGHIRHSATGILDAFFIRYAARAEGRIGFFDWVRDEYDEVGLRADFAASGWATLVNDRLLARE